MATAASTMATYNTDVYGLVRRINRFIEEVVKSQSSGVSKTSTFDVARMRSYIAAMRAYMNWVTTQPELDLPETGPRPTALPPSPVIPLIENESLYDVAVLFELARDELAHSQSSRMSSNLIGFDASRFTAILDKADKFIDEYVTLVDPLDLPETSPSKEVTGKGLLGV
jgi:hypothetical protein